MHTALTRRALLGTLAVGALWRNDLMDTQEPDPRRMPVGFVSHGAPDLALDRAKGADLTRWARSMPSPSAILIVSAHWERAPMTIGTSRTRPLIHDYGGFDPRLRETVYAAPGAPDLAERVAELLGDDVAQEDERAWDHGVWVPLVHMAPEAKTPVLQLSLPSRLSARELFALGRTLRPLRDENVALLASGGLVHNLRALDWSDSGSPAAWAVDFESWIRDALERRDHDDLLDFTRRAPALREAHPTLEHLQPLFVALGAAHDEDAVRFPVEGFEYGSLSRTAVQFG